MRKLSKLLFMVFACSVLISLCFSGMVSAKEYRGTKENLNTMIHWTVNTIERTLTLEGKGSFGTALGNPWDSYLTDVDTVSVSNGIYVNFTDTQLYQNLVIHKKLENGFSWKYDGVGESLTVYGKGEISQSLETEHGEFSKITITDGITGFDPKQLNNWCRTKILKLGKDVKSVNLGVRCASTSYEVDPANPYLAAFDDCLYTKEYDTLFACPPHKTSIAFPNNVKTVSEWAFTGSAIRELIIPWTVTTIEEHAFSGMGDYVEQKFVRAIAT